MLKKIKKNLPNLRLHVFKYLINANEVTDNIVAMPRAKHTYPYIRQPTEKNI